MIGRGVGEKCYSPSVEVWAAGEGSLLTSNAKGFGVLVTGKSKVKRQLGKAQHPPGRLGWSHLQVGASLAENLDRQHVALGMQMCIQMYVCIWWPLTGRVRVHGPPSLEPVSSLDPPAPAAMQRDVLPRLQGLKGWGAHAPHPAMDEPRLLETRAVFLSETVGRVLFACSIIERHTGAGACRRGSPDGQTSLEDCESSVWLQLLCALECIGKASDLGWSSGHWGSSFEH